MGIGISEPTNTIAAPQAAATWSTHNSEDLYGIQGWGNGYFRINTAGHVTVHPGKRAQHAIDLKELIERVGTLGIQPPILFRFPQILKHRLGEIHDAFMQARRDCNYHGKYTCVYPIKVNQQRHVVEEILRFGKEYGFGIEAGSKPELLAVLALVEDNNTPIICNGFKDQEYLNLVLLARALGRKIIPVMESQHELERFVALTKQMGLQPLIGLRLKLSSRGSGRWEESGGAGSKFGLTVSEVLRALEYLQAQGLEKSLNLLHFHIGSQITNIRNIKEAVNEAARIYVEMYQAGAGLELLDVGGGLGIDYHGSQTNAGSSMNYTLREYASDVIFGVQSVCDRARIPHPEIVTESGRAIAAFYSVLTFNVLGMSSPKFSNIPERPKTGLQPPLDAFYDTLAEIRPNNLLEMFHDATKYRDDLRYAFNLGYLTLAQRDLGEQLFWAICEQIRKYCRELPHYPEDLCDLDIMLADTYFCNYSVFQSMPDSWAVQQLFPVMPLHRLAERPDRLGVLADLTCDSDGKIDRFIDSRRMKRVLELHSLREEPYYLGAFLVGAYQEILGDLHNLFGDTHAVHVTLNSRGQLVIDGIVQGDTNERVLSYVQFSASELEQRVNKQLHQAQEESLLSSELASSLQNLYREGLRSYTYLKDQTPHVHSDGTSTPYWSVPEPNAPMPTPMPISLTNGNDANQENE